MKKPVIGITISREHRPQGVFNSLCYDYADSVIAAGGIPMFLPVATAEEATDYIENIDGLLLSGGCDIAPKYFNEEPVIGIGKVDSVRDEIEFALFREAFKRNIPILGICRGMQLINVSLNGTLYQDIDSQIKNVNAHHPQDVTRDELYHSVNVKPDTVLSGAFKDLKIRTNSFHHQAINKLGEGLIINALSQEGIIEGIEYTDCEKHFVLGVQWHPENLGRKYPEFLNIFKFLIEKSKK